MRQRCSRDARRSVRRVLHLGLVPRPMRGKLGVGGGQDDDIAPVLWPEIDGFRAIGDSHRVARAAGASGRRLRRATPPVINGTNAGQGAHSAFSMKTLEPFSSYSPNGPIRRHTRSGRRSAGPRGSSSAGLQPHHRDGPASRATSSNARRRWHRRSPARAGRGARRSASVRHSHPAGQRHRRRLARRQPAQPERRRPHPVTRPERTRYRTSGG